MEDQMLKILIQNACQSGVVSASDKEIIYRKAQQLSIKPEIVDQMIEQELQKNKDEGLESGFMAIEDMQNTSEKVLDSKISEMKEQSKFADQRPLSFQGAMSTVYQAKLYGKWIIIKRIKPEFKDNPKYKELFIREFENAYHLDHPHIVRLLDKGEDQEGLYYTMEYIDGRSLSEMITTTGINNERLAEKAARQIIDALLYVHKKQIYHRDLKPDNIFVTYRGDNVKILDFGLAAADNFEDNLSKAGTPRYASPEQMDPNKSIDQRSDIYSFGKIFLEMLTGETKIEALTKVVNPVYSYIIEKSVEENPDERFADCDEILDVFKNPSLVPEKKMPLKTEIKNPVKKEIKEQKPKESEGTNKVLIPLLIGLGVLVIAFSLYFFVFKNKGNSPLINKKGTNSLISKADSLFNVGEYIEANDVYQGISKKDKHVNSQISILDKILKKYNEATKVFDGKNIARALGMYEQIEKDFPKFKKVTEKIEICKNIIKNADYKTLQVVPESSTNKLGFADKDGNVVVDYQFDYVAPLKDWHKVGLIPVQINNKYGFIDKNKNYFAKCIYSKTFNGKYVWQPTGYQVEKDGQKVYISVDKNGNGSIK